MGADGSKSSDDSVPLIFSEMRSARGNLTRALWYNHFQDSLHYR